MANDKNMPAGESIPLWGEGSVDSNYAAPGEPYDGTPYHVDPASLTVNGYTPKDHPTAQELNHHLYEIGQWLKYLARFAPLNFYPTVNAGVSLTAGDIAYSSKRGRYYIAGYDNFPRLGIASSMNGRDWVTETITGAPYNNVFGTAVLCVPNSNVVLVGCTTSTTASVFRSSTVAGDFASVSVANCRRIASFAKDVTNDLIIAVGQDTSNNPAIWTSSNDGASWTQRTVPNTLTNTRITRIAIDESGPVYCAVDSAASALYRSTDGVTWTESAQSSLAAGGNMAAVHIAYSETEKLFGAFSGSGYFHTSPDGITWTERAAVGFDDASYVCTGLVSVGGAWVWTMVGTYGVLDAKGREGSIWISYDNGDTQFRFNPPSNDSLREEHGSGNVDEHHGIKVAQGSGQLMLLGANTDGGGYDCYVSLGLRMFPDGWVNGLV